MATAPTIEQSDMVQQFAEWVRTKPADEEYDYCSSRGCAFAQFLSASGMASKPIVVPSLWRDGGRPALDWQEYSDEINAATLEIPRTFGALAERLSA